jgi:putative DNA primase/helicase
MDTLEKNTRIGSALEELASLKGLSIGFLEENGFSDAPNGHIRIDYGTGRRARMRKRAETSKDNAYWDKFTESLPMRAFTNSKFKKVGGTVYIVEGETDCITGWSHNLWTVGVPGATLVKRLELEDIEGAEKVYVMQEPDEAGSRFPHMVGNRLRDIGYTGEIYAVKLRQWKDLSELHCAHPGQHELFMTLLSSESDKTKLDIPLPVATNGKGRALATRRLSDVVEAEVSWLWPDRIPYGKVTLLAGNPGVGKSYMTCAIAGFVTNGNPFPHSGGAQREPQAVLMWNGEDQAEDIVRPRARKCGANLELIEVIDGVRDDTGKVQPFSLKDVDMIVELVTQRGNIGLVVIDPISATMKGVDSHRAVEVHSALQPLVDLAKSTRIAVIIVAHLRKGESVEALYRVGGSVAFSAAPRAGLLCERDPDEPTRTYLASLKHNYSGEAQALEYGTGDEGLWFGKTSKHTAQTLLAAPRYGGVKDKAKSLLCELLADGPVPSAKIYETAKERGISEKAIKRAKDDLGIASEKVGGAWYFSMPETKADA